MPAQAVGANSAASAGLTMEEYVDHTQPQPRCAATPNIGLTNRVGAAIFASQRSGKWRQLTRTTWQKSAHRVRRPINSSNDRHSFRSVAGSWRPNATPVPHRLSLSEKQQEFTFY